MTTLATRIETEEPSQALLEAMAVAAGWTRHIQRPHRPKWLAPDGTWRVEPPPWLTDLTAAAGLMPEGWIVRIGQVRFGIWHAQAWRGDKSFKSPSDAAAVATTEPRARAALAMRAVAAPAPEQTTEDRNG